MVSKDQALQNWNSFRKDARLKNHNGFTDLFLDTEKVEAIAKRLKKDMIYAQIIRELHTTKRSIKRVEAYLISKGEL